MNSVKKGELSSWKFLKFFFPYAWQHTNSLDKMLMLVSFVLLISASLVKLYSTIILKSAVDSLSASPDFFLISFYVFLL